MNIDKTLLASSTAVPAVGPALATDRARTRIGVRAWVLTAFLFLVPLVAYWPATFHDYGLRDDYSNLREAHEEPGKVLKFCASHARPIYGMLLQASYGQTSSVRNLRWMRLLSALLLGAISLVSFRGLRALRWSFNASLCFALAVVLVPSAQVIAGWAVGWPYAAAALIAVGGFFTAEGALAAAAGSARRLVQWAVALGLMVLSALIYQPSALFYVVPLSAALIARREYGAGRCARWVGIHLGMVTAAMAMAYFTMTALYATGVFVKSGRIAFEQHWTDKLGWFVQEPLTNALSLLVLNDNNHLDRALYLGCAGSVALILLGGAVLEWRRHGRTRGLIWLAGLAGFPVFSFAVCLIASEHYATYRTIFAMTAVLLCFLIASIRSLTSGLGTGRRLALAAAACAALFFTAQHHAYALLAVPQGNEWQLIVDGARQVRLQEGRRPSIFAIKSSPADISTATIYHDEFGSLSSNSEWVPKEMFKRAMHDLHPDVPNLDARYDFATGAKLPSGRHFDVIIDLHRLRRFYSDN
ncbi:MAG: hypothetical protein WB440_21185 [Steroidobacteraceae bacterium]